MQWLLFSDRFNEFTLWKHSNRLGDRVVDSIGNYRCICCKRTASFRIIVLLLGEEGRIQKASKMAFVDQWIDCSHSITRVELPSNWNIKKARVLMPWPFYKKKRELKSHFFLEIVVDCIKELLCIKIMIAMADFVTVDTNSQVFSHLAIFYSFNTN